MINSEYAIAYSEVLEILKYIPKEDFDKIPNSRIELYKTNCDKNYVFNYNPNKTLTDQNVSKTAKAIVALLFRDYWATQDQREKIILYQKHERAKIEEEKKKKYNSNNLFKEEKIEKLEIKEEDKSLAVIQKENIFSKILNKIKKFFIK